MRILVTHVHSVCKNRCREFEQTRRDELTGCVGAGASPAWCVGYDVAVGYLKLVACLLFFTTAFTLFGIAGAHDSGVDPEYGMVSGGLVGLFFGLLVGGGITGRLLDAVYPPGDGGGGEDP